MDELKAEVEKAQPQYIPKGGRWKKRQRYGVAAYNRAYWRLEGKGLVPGPPHEANEAAKRKIEDDPMKRSGAARKSAIRNKSSEKEDEDEGVELSQRGVQFTPTCGGTGHLVQDAEVTGVELSQRGVQFTPTCGGTGHLVTESGATERGEEAQQSHEEEAEEHRNMQEYIYQLFQQRARKEDEEESNEDSGDEEEDIEKTGTGGSN